MAPNSVDFFVYFLQARGESSNAERDGGEARERGREGDRQNGIVDFQTKILMERLKSAENCGAAPSKQQANPQPITKERNDPKLSSLSSFGFITNSPAWNV